MFASAYAHNKQLNHFVTTTRQPSQTTYRCILNRESPFSIGYPYRSMLRKCTGETYIHCFQFSSGSQNIDERTRTDDGWASLRERKVDTPAVFFIVSDIPIVACSENARVEPIHPSYAGTCFRFSSKISINGGTICRYRPLVECAKSVLTT